MDYVWITPPWVVASADYMCSPRVVSYFPRTHGCRREAVPLRNWRGDAAGYLVSKDFTEAGEGAAARGRYELPQHRSAKHLKEVPLLCRGNGLMVGLELVNLLGGETHCRRPRLKGPPETSRESTTRAAAAAIGTGNPCGERDRKGLARRGEHHEWSNRRRRPREGKMQSKRRWGIDFAPVLRVGADIHVLHRFFPVPTGKVQDDLPLLDLLLSLEIGEVPVHVLDVHFLSVESTMARPRS